MPEESAPAPSVDDAASPIPARSRSIPIPKSDSPMRIHIGTPNIRRHISKSLPKSLPHFHLPHFHSDPDKDTKPFKGVH